MQQENDGPANRRVLISGASIAGPALALWLRRYGFEVTVVERSAEIRRAGQAVDFKGETHMDVLARMGILEAVRQAQLPRGKDGVIIDALGRQISKIPVEFSSGELEILRGDLARILYERTAADCEYVFGDSIASLTETSGGIDVSFEHGAPRSFDLIVGADGIHSNVRKIAFGPESNYVKHLGHYYALADLGEDPQDEDVMYNEPGWMAATGGPKAPAFFVFASGPLSYDRDDVDEQKRILMQAYKGGAWRISALMHRMPAAKEFYMDSISRVTTNTYAKGRIVLLGDSAYGNALGGFGTGLAIVGAYVLAGELHRACGQYAQAYLRYEEKIRPYAKVSQNVNAGKLLAPLTSWGLSVRNALFSVAPLFAGVMKAMDYFATNITLEDYNRER